MGLLAFFPPLLGLSRVLPSLEMENTVGDKRPSNLSLRIDQKMCAKSLERMIQIN